MANTTPTLPDLSHQTPTADVSTIRVGDRITLLGEPTESAIQVTSVKPPSPDGAVYLGGATLSPRGKPYVRGGRGLYVSGTAGGTWDWYRIRKPLRPASTGRYRLIQVEGDNAPIWRVARDYSAVARITVAPDPAFRLDMHTYPSIELIVNPDGTWTLRRWPGAAATAQQVLLASGHIADEEPQPLG